MGMEHAYVSSFFQLSFGSFQTFWRVGFSSLFFSFSFFVFWVWIAVFVFCLFVWLYLGAHVGTLCVCQDVLLSSDTFDAL